MRGGGGVRGTRLCCALGIGCGHELQDFFERRDLEYAVVTRIRAPQLRQPLARAQGFSSASVKSSVNQPESGWPSTVRVVRRAANSGCDATSVVPPISFSCRTTRAPSRVITRSGST